MQYTEAGFAIPILLLSVQVLSSVQLSSIVQVTSDFISLIWLHPPNNNIIKNEIKK